MSQSGHIVQDPHVGGVQLFKANVCVCFILMVDGCFHLSQPGYRAKQGSSSKCPRVVLACNGDKTIQYFVYTFVLTYSSQCVSPARSQLSSITSSPIMCLFFSIVMFHFSIL